jgi:hypothetical protein
MLRHPVPPHFDKKNPSLASTRYPFIEIMQQSWPPQSSKGFLGFLPEKHPQKFLSFKSNPLFDSSTA